MYLCLTFHFFEYLCLCCYMFTYMVARILKCAYFVCVFLFEFCLSIRECFASFIQYKHLTSDKMIGTKVCRHKPEFR